MWLARSSVHSSGILYLFIYLKEFYFILFYFISFHFILAVSGLGCGRQGRH